MWNLKQKQNYERIERRKIAKGEEVNVGSSGLVNVIQVIYI
jgi:hypothetical protein